MHCAFYFIHADSHSGTESRLFYLCWQPSRNCEAVYFIYAESCLGTGKPSGPSAAMLKVTKMIPARVRHQLLRREQRCAEIGLQEANRHASYTTMHALWDPGGAATDGSASAPPRDWPSGSCRPRGSCVLKGSMGSAATTRIWKAPFLHLKWERNTIFRKGAVVWEKMTQVRVIGRQQRTCPLALVERYRSDLTSSVDSKWIAGMVAWIKESRKAQCERRPGGVYVFSATEEARFPQQRKQLCVLGIAFCLNSIFLSAFVNMGANTLTIGHTVASRMWPAMHSCVPSNRMSPHSQHVPTCLISHIRTSSDLPPNRVASWSFWQKFPLGPTEGVLVHEYCSTIDPWNFELRTLSALDLVTLQMHDAALRSHGAGVRLAHAMPFYMFLFNEEHMVFASMQDMWYVLQNCALCL